MFLKVTYTVHKVLQMSNKSKHSTTRFLPHFSQIYLGLVKGSFYTDSIRLATSSAARDATQIAQGRGRALVMIFNHIGKYV